MSVAPIQWADAEDDTPSMFNYRADEDDEGWQDAVSARTKKRRNRLARKREHREVERIASANNPHFIARDRATSIQEIVKVQGFTPFILSTEGVRLQQKGVLVGFQKSSEGHIDLEGKPLAEPKDPYEYVHIPGNTWNDRCIFTFSDQ